MLVTAGKRAYLGILGRSFGAHGIDIALGILPLGLFTEEGTELLVAVQGRNNGIVTNGADAEDTGGPALFRQHGKAILDGLAGVAVTAGLAIQGKFCVDRAKIRDEIGKLLLEEYSFCRVRFLMQQLCYNHKEENLPIHFQK